MNNFDPKQNYEESKKATGYISRKLATQADYDRIGFKSGLEVHQQLFTKEKLFFLNNDKQPIVIEQLEGRISQMITGVTEPTIVLRIDNSLSIQDLVDVLTIGNKLKVKMVLATKSEKS